MPEPSPRLLMENRNWYDSLIKMLKMLRSTRIVLLLVLHCTCSQLFAFSIFHVSWHLALIFTAQLLWSILNILNHPPKPSLRTTGPPADSNHPESYPYHMQINICVLYQINTYLSTDTVLLNISGHSVYCPRPPNSDIHSYIPYISIHLYQCPWTITSCQNSCILSQGMCASLMPVMVPTFAVQLEVDAGKQYGNPWLKHLNLSDEIKIDVSNTYQDIQDMLE